MRVIKIKSPYFLILLFCFFSVFRMQTIAQGICPSETIKIGELKGKIVALSENAEPIKQAKIELKQIDETETVVETTTTDENGKFSISNVKQGEYKFVVSIIFDGKVFYEYYLGLQVKDKLKKAKKKRLLLVKMGTTCFESKASLVNSL